MSVTTEPDTAAPGEFLQAAVDGVREPVEWPHARHDGRRIVNVANYNRKAVTVQIRRDGDAISPRRELRADESVSRTEIDIPRQTAKLLVLPG